MVASQHFVPVLRGRSCQGGVYVGKIGYIHRPWNVARPPAPEMSIATVVQFRKQTIYDGDTRLSQGGQDLLFAGQPPRGAFFAAAAGNYLVDLAIDFENLRCGGSAPRRAEVKWTVQPN